MADADPLARDENRSAIVNQHSSIDNQQSKSALDPITTVIVAPSRQIWCAFF